MSGYQGALSEGQGLYVEGEAIVVVLTREEAKAVVRGDEGANQELRASLVDALAAPRP